MKLTIKCILILNILLFMITGCGGQPIQASIPTHEPAIPLSDCQLSSPGMAYSISARCGKLAVFEDQTQKSGRKIDLHIAVIPAVSKTPLPDALFLLAGGPGQAATETFPQLISILDRLHQKRDLVLVDQRGTGQSNPLRCQAGSGEADGVSNAQDSAEKQAEQLKNCLAQLGADTRLYTTAAAVEDLDQVRAALGYERINLLGISYGTRVAQAYLRQYPQHTRTATLDSVNPLNWELGPDNAANAQHALDLVFERCAADLACRAAFPDVRSEFNALLASLEKQPVEVALPHPTTNEMTTVTLDRNTLATTIQILLYTPESVAFIPLLIHETTVRKDYHLLAAQYLIASDGLGESIFNGLYLSVLCAEDAPFYPANPGNVASFLPDRTTDFRKQCALWPHAQAPEAFKQAVKSDIPTLLLSGEADPITPPANAEKAAKGLANSLSLIVPGIGHNVIFRGCVPKIMTSFIETGSPLGLDTACVKDVKPAPFMVNFSGSKP